MFGAKIKELKKSLIDCQVDILSVHIGSSVRKKLTVAEKKNFSSLHVWEK